MKKALVIVEIIFGILIFAAGFIMTLTLFTGSWYGGIGLVVMIAGYFLALDGNRSYKKLRNKK